MEESLLNEFIDILAQFGAGKGEPGNTAVRFLLPAFFWSVLAWISYKEFRIRRSNKALFIFSASTLGIGREMLMFISEYGSHRGYLSHTYIYYYYPPIEHAVTMASCILIAYAFMSYLLSSPTLSRRYLYVSLTLTALLYVINALFWPRFLVNNPGTLFGAFWGDMAFRIAASLTMGTALIAFIYARQKGKHFPGIILLGFLFFFLDEFLMIFNLATDEVHIAIYAPIRHNLHIWAIPAFLAAYWFENLYILEMHQKELKRSLKEKEALLKELHHRVKNNMAVISSLLSLQEARAQSEESAEVLKDFQSRIYTMSLVHEELFGSDDIGEIELKGYIESLTENIILSFGDSAAHIDCRLEIEHVPLNMDRLIPFGLILNEAITNTVKHAFRGIESPVISVRVTSNEEDFTLSVEDNGIGIPEEVDIFKTKALGSKIIRTLVKQLKGKIQVDTSREGTSIKMTCPI
jgi:two-component sensor histidine kinase